MPGLHPISRGARREQELERSVSSGRYGKSRLREGMNRGSSKSSSSSMPFYWANVIRTELIVKTSFLKARY